MKLKIFLIFIFIALTAIFNEAEAQQVLLRVDKPFVAKNLSGIITDSNGETMPLVTVTRFTSNWRKEIEFVETNANGKFSFKKLPVGIHYLRISARGFNELEVKVKITKNSKAKLKFKLDIST